MRGRHLWILEEFNLCLVSGKYATLPEWKNSSHFMCERSHKINCISLLNIIVHQLKILQMHNSDTFISVHCIVLHKIHRRLCVNCMYVKSHVIFLLILCRQCTLLKLVLFILLLLQMPTNAYQKSEKKFSKSYWLGSVTSI